MPLRFSPESLFGRLSLTRKLTAMSMVTAGSATLLACAILLLYDISNSRGRLIRDTDVLAEVVGANSTAALAFGDAKAAAETLRAVAADHHIVYAAILRGSGEAFADYQRDPGPRRGDAARHLAGPVWTGSVPTHTFDRERLVLTRPIQLDRE